VEIIAADARPHGDLVQIAYADTREEAALIRGLLREEGIRSLARQAGIEGGIGSSSLLTRSPRSIYVRPEDADRGRTLLAETMVEDPLEVEIPESANAEYLADATGHRPRNYGVFGFYLRTYAFAIVVFAVVVLVFLLLR
jgi:hypothetical protein